MRNTDTAVKDRSIWRGLSRQTFERQTKYLNDHQHVAGPRDYSVLEDAEANEAYVLPFRLERQLADDIAYICAFEAGVQTVTAATVQHVSAGLTVRLAANEGVRDLVTTSMDELLSVVRRCASKATSKVLCHEQLLDIVVRLNVNRILLRLGSKKAKLPNHLRAATKLSQPLPSRLRDLLRSTIGKSKKAELRISTLLGDLDDAFGKLERAEPAEVHDALKVLVEVVYNIAPNSEQLQQRLAPLGLQSTSLDIREIREIDKIAKYWRICSTLTKASRRFPELFQTIDCVTVEPFRPSTKSTIVGRQHVHAEIQLVTFYETAGIYPLPRVIGASKEACFLCDAFIAAHGAFGVTRAHRQTYCIWTVPDLGEYSDDTVQRFRAALRQVAADVNSEFVKAQGRKSQRTLRAPQIFPLQSSHDLSRYAMSTPSALTLLSVKSDSNRIDTAGDAEHDNKGEIARSPCSHSETSQASKMSVEETPPPYEADCEVSTKSLGDYQHSTSRAEDADDTFNVGELMKAVHSDGPSNDAYHVLTTQPRIIKPTSWLHLHVSRHPALTDDAANAGTGRSSFLTARRLQAEEPDVPNIALMDLSTSSELTLMREDATAALRFVLRHASGEAVLVECRWPD